MDTRDSPTVTVTVNDEEELSNRKIGSRVLAALAHTPARRSDYGYHAIVVSRSESVDLTAQEVVDSRYDLYLNHQFRITDERRETVGNKVTDRLQTAEESYIILGRS
jgi:hypothetical protein